MKIERLLTDEQIRQAHREYQDGKSVRQVADEFFVNSVTLYKYFHVLGLPLRESVTSQKVLTQRAREHTDEILKLRESGKLLKEIAAKFYVSETSIRRIIKEAEEPVKAVGA